MQRVINNIVNNDILPNDVWKWNYVENIIRQTMELYSFKEIRTSIIQSQELFESYLNYYSEEENSSKRLLFNLNGVSNLSLRPEGTITVLHSLMKNNINELLSRLFYIGPMFRKQNDNKLSQIHQFGAEIIGSDDLLTDSEIILLAIKVFKSLEIFNYQLEISSFGCSKCRINYVKELNKFIRSHQDEYCPECHYNIKLNPFQVFQCENSNCENISNLAPVISDYLCKECSSHLKKLQKMLSNLGIAYVVAPYLPTAFNYYNRTIFRFVIEENGHKTVLANGGRYDFLASSVLKKKVHAIGFSADFESIIRVMENRNIFMMPKNQFKVLISPMAPDLDVFVLQIAQEMHENNIHTIILSFTKDFDYMTTIANNYEAEVDIRISDELIREGKLLVKNNLKNHQEPVQIADIGNYIQTIKKSTIIQ